MEVLEPCHELGTGLTGKHDVAQDQIESLAARGRERQRLVGTARRHDGVAELVRISAASARMSSLSSTTRIVSVPSDRRDVRLRRGA